MTNDLVVEYAVHVDNNMYMVTWNENNSFYFSRYIHNYGKGDSRLLPIFWFSTGHKINVTDDISNAEWRKTVSAQSKLFIAEYLQCLVKKYGKEEVNKFLKGENNIIHPS